MSFSSDPDGLALESYLAVAAFEDGNALEHVEVVDFSALVKVVVQDEAASLGLASADPHPDLPRAARVRPGLGLGKLWMLSGFGLAMMLGLLIGSFSLFFSFFSLIKQQPQSTVVS